MDAVDRVGKEIQGAQATKWLATDVVQDRARRGAKQGERRAARFLWEAA